MQQSVEMSRASPDYVKAVECGVPPTQAVETKIYRKRWLVLAIFVVYSASNAMQWTQYSIIGDKITKFYGVSGGQVDLTSMIFMIMYIPFIFPASYLLDKFGLRNAVLIGAIGTALGAWIKVFSASPDKFWLTFIGHTIVASSQTFILSVPPRLAAVWFGPDQVSSACSIGVFGNQLGCAIGFVFPPMFMTLGSVGYGLQVMFYCVAAVTTINLVLIILFFQAQPPLPPSPTQGQRDADTSEDFFQSIKRLLLNSGYLLLLLSYGINVGIFYALSTLLNDLILKHFPGADTDAGRIGLTIICAGMAGSVVCGVILDKTRRFKETTFGVYLFSFLSFIIFTFILDSGSIIIVYFTAGLLGFFMTGYLPVGFEFAAELTYPEPEFTSAGLLNAFTQICGILLIMVYRPMIENWGDLYANIAFCCMLALGALITLLTPNHLRRQKAEKDSANSS